MQPAISAIPGGLRSRRVLAAALSSALLLEACSPGTSSTNSSPRPGGSVTVASWQEQDSLLSCNITAASPHTCAYVNPAMEGLLTVKANQDIPNNPKLADYYFGHNPANRFELTKGRDLVVDPEPESGPINFLAYPLLEMNGEVIKPDTIFEFRRIGI